jgi:hypothetical protein
MATLNFALSTLHPHFHYSLLIIQLEMEAYIVAGYRTAVGKASRGGFRYVRPDNLAASVIKHLVQSVPALDPARSKT